jgi:hypothetical protein
MPDRAAFYNGALDPRRLYITQVILYGGAFVIVALSVWAAPPLR